MTDFYKEFIHLFCCCHEHTKHNLIFFDDSWSLNHYLHHPTVWYWIHRNTIYKNQIEGPLTTRQTVADQKTSLMQSVSLKYV